MTPTSIRLLLLASLAGLACGTTAPAASAPAAPAAASPEAAPTEAAVSANAEAVVEAEALPEASPAEVPSEAEDKKTSDAGVATTEAPSDREYIACGCGCGAGGGNAQEVPECVPSRGKLQRIIKQDEASRNNPICASAGASLGQRYRLCPNVK